MYVECKPDKALVLGLTRWDHRQVTHELKGKGGIANRLSQGMGHGALVDQDPGKPTPLYFQGLQVEWEDQSLGLRLLRDRQRNHRVFVLMPDLEGWIVAAARRSGVSLAAYDLPNDPDALHQVINVNLERFKELVDALKRTNHLESLRRLLIT